mmetsp:Transcript_47034/g.84780  ORF Transcript_47034/g.84780 Transcript_47034/m.84780 type:complete len:244 (+) Transcript_47034:140-871(+)
MSPQGQSPAGLRSRTTPVSPSKPPAPNTPGKAGAVARSGAAKASSAAPPPWATHGPDLDVPLKPSQRKRASAPAVQFRGTESLVSLHRIDQDMAADARLSQRLGIMTSGRLSRLTAREDEDRLNNSTLGSSLTSTQAGAVLRASSLGRTEASKSRNAGDDSGRTIQSASSRPRSGSATVSSPAPSHAAPSGVPSPGPRPAPGASPPWIAIPHSSRRPSRESGHGHRSYVEQVIPSPNRRATAQ